MAISVGSVEVDIVPNTRGIAGRLRSALVPAATRAGQEAGDAAGRSMQAAMADVGSRIGRQVGAQIAAGITSEVRGALREGVTQGGRTARPAAGRQGRETGGAFARSARARIEAAFRSLPDVTIGADTTDADSDIQALRARLETLSSRRVGVDIAADEARAEITDIEEQLRRLGAAHPNPTVRADTAAARAELAALRGEIDRVSADPARVRVETDGTFGQRLRAAVQQAETSLPNINIDADTSPAQAELANLRAQLSALRDLRVGIDIDAATAQARVEEIQARLQRLAASDADVAVRVDAGAAAGQLAAVQGMVSALDGRTASVHVSTRQAQRALLHLTALIGGLGAVPAIPVAAAGIGSIAAAATAAGAGVGALAAVAIPAFSGIKGALDAQKQAQDAASAATAEGGQAAASAARRSLQLEGAQQALASAHRNAARQIAQAEQGVQDAVRQAAQANRRAAGQVASARRGLADAVQQAADRQRAAAEQVERAEDQLANAQRTAQRAQQDLTQARRDAAAELVDLSNRLASAQLSERDAALSVQEAERRLRATQAAGSQATLLERQRAQLAYDQAVQRLKEQRLETRRLSAQKEAADKAGVEGSETVRSAQQRLAEAQRAVQERTQGLKQAQQDAAREQVRSQQAIAEAQRKVAEAQRNVTRVQEQGARSVARAQQQLVAAQESAAESIASAQRRIRSAQLSAAGGADRAAAAQAKYRQALAEMTPAARGTFHAFVRLREAFGAWSRALQPQVMPIFTRALNGIRKALPALTPFVREAAAAIGDLQDRASRGFASPWWQTFKRDLQGSVRPAITGLGVSFGNVFKGITGVIQAFLPHMGSISRRMREITGRFADWGAGLKGSPQFERFLSYSAEQAPVLAAALGDVSGAVVEVVRALEPLSGPVLEVFGVLARGVASVAETLPWLVQGIYAAIVATRLWTIGMAIFNAVTKANPIGLIVIAIVALVAAVVYAYKRFGWFRDAVQAAWHGIQVAAQWTWERVLKPTFDALAAAFRWVADVAMWLWRNVLGPVFRGIGAVISWWWNNIVRRYFQLVRGVFRGLAQVAKWLWRKGIKPAFDGIAAVVTWWWRNIVRRYFQLVMAVIRTVAGVFKWLYNKGVKPAFGWIADRAKWLWRKALRPAFDWIKEGVRRVRDTFSDAKDAIGKSWGKLTDIAKKPVRFVVERVYNDGIRKVFNKVADFVGIDPLGKVRLPKGFRDGGRVRGPGTETSDSIPALLSRNEHVWTAREVHGAGGHGAVMALRQAAAAGEVPGFAEGGIVDWFTDKARRVGSAVVDGAKLLANPGKLWDKATGFVRGLLGHLQDSRWARMLARVPKRMLSALKDHIVDAVFGGGGGRVDVGGHGVRRWTPMVRQVLRMLGAPASALDDVLTRIRIESGGNPRAINNWDINARRGIASRGLMQTIPPTFNAYAGPFRSRGIYDPLANIYAGVNYARHRYGRDWIRIMTRPGGYDSGGYLPEGLSLAYNGTGRPEPVFTTAQANALMRTADGGGVAAQGGDFTGRLYLDSGEFLGTVRGEVESTLRPVAAALRSGRRG